MLPASNYVLNIVELQNVVTSATGLTPAGFLSNQLTQIQQMVQFDQKRINVNVISNFDTSPIQIVSPINLSNVSLTATGVAGGIQGTLGTSGSTLTTIGSASTLLTVGINGDLQFTQSSLSTFYITGTGSAYFSGPVSAQNFITTSDRTLKKNIDRIVDYETILSSINGVRFEWVGCSCKRDVGVIAQEVLAVLPEAVEEGPEGLQVAYMKLIPVLIEAVKSLQERVRKLEGEHQ